MSAWQANTPYNVGDFVTNGGNTYECTRQGTSVMSGSGPTGTGSDITDGTVHWEYYPSAETYAQAFVVYVPPNSGDKTYESCLRLGTGPASSTADERTTYNDVVSTANTLSGLSSETYSPNHGIALLTPGTINMLAAEGVNTTCGSFTNSTIGPSYTITQDGSQIITASYTHKGIDTLGLWATVSFNQASTVAVNMIPGIQANFGTAVLSYALSGPVSFSNSYGLGFSSAAGWYVTAQMARVVNVGYRTVVSNKVDGSNNEYYTAQQASSTAQTFSWTVPVRGKWTAFDTLQERYCKLVNKLAVATEALTLVYSAAGLIAADVGSPSAVQTWLDFAEPMALLCSAANAIFAALGLWLGGKVDDLSKDSNLVNWGATNLTIDDGSFWVQTETPPKPEPPPPPAPPPPDPPPTAPWLKVDRQAKQVTLSTGNPATATTLRLDGTGGATAGVTLGKTGGALITMSDSNLILQFGNSTSITLDATGIVMNAGGHSATVKSDGIAIAGLSVKIEALQLQIYSLLSQINTGLNGLAEAAQAANALSLAVAQVQRMASAAAAMVADAVRAAAAAAAAPLPAPPSTPPPP